MSPRRVVAHWWLRFGCAVTLIAAAVVNSSSSQTCNEAWLEGSGILGINGHVYSMVDWDPDGTGPLSSVLAVGGAFTIAGSTYASGVACWDGVQWKSLGTGIPMTYYGQERVYALAALPNGDLLAAGRFTVAGEVTANHIARWDGVSWKPLGSGMNNQVGALAVLPSGHVVAAGWFTQAGGIAANRIALWNGNAWAPLGSGMNQTVEALAVLPSGELVAGGSFTVAGGTPAAGIARWTGSGWSSLGSGMTATSGTATVSALAVTANGQLIAGGLFSVAGSAFANNVARWNGTDWSTFGVGVSLGSVRALKILTNGDLVAGGTFQFAGGTAASFVARWNGADWSSLNMPMVSSGMSNLPAAVRSLAQLSGGDLVVGGEISLGNGKPNGIVRWDGSAWIPFVAAGCWGVSHTVRSVVALPNGEVVAAGDFAFAGDERVDRVARWDGTKWAPLGAGVTNTSGFPPQPAFAYVNALAVLTNGDLVAGGHFKYAGGTPANYIARWDGSHWFPLAQGMNWTVDSLVVLPNGDLVAGGEFTVAGNVAAHRIARWDGANWSAIGSGFPQSNTDTRVSALAILQNGDLIAGGKFTTGWGAPADYLARWDGTTWQGMGFGIGNAVRALAVLPNGDLVAGGIHTASVGSIARWDGTAWWPLGGMDDSVHTLAVAPTGELIAGGIFTKANGVTVNSIARLEGTTWAALDAGVGDGGWPIVIGGLPTPDVTSLTVLQSGEIVAGGSFFTAGGSVASNIARFGCEIQCGTITTLGSPCVGSGGFSPTLTVTGCAAASQTLSMRIDQGLGNSLAILFVGSQPGTILIGANCSFPMTSVAASYGPLPLSGDGAGQGHFDVAVALPATLPAITGVIAAACADSGVPLGYSLTNGVQITTSGP